MVMKIPKAAPERTPHGQNGQKKVKPISVYYHKKHKEYIFERSPGNYQSHTLSRTRKLLTDMGHLDVEKIIKKGEEVDHIDYSGSIAGRMPGRYDENGRSVLVTDGPKIIAGVEGDWPTINHIIRHMIGSESETYSWEQWNTFHGILKNARQSLLDGIWRQKQAMAFCGPVNSGKSLLQEIITVIVGGRCARTTMYVQGNTQS